MGADDTRAIKLGIKAMKILVEEMPTIPMICYTTITPVDEYYWKNFPSADNPYLSPESNWANYGFVLSFIKPTGRREDSVNN